MCCGILINDYALQLEKAVVDGEHVFSELLLRFSDYLRVKNNHRRYER